MNKEILVFIKNIVFFMVVAFLVYFVCVALSGDFLYYKYRPNLKYPAADSKKRFAEVKLKDSVDILFLGSSHAYRGFDTRIFDNYGYYTFNLGSSSQTPLQTELLLCRYLERLKPKLIVYEVYPEALIMDGIESSIDIIASDNQDIYSLEMVIKQRHTKIFNTFLYALYKQNFSLNNTNTQYRSRLNDTYISGGYVERKKQYSTYGKLRKKELKLNTHLESVFQKKIRDLKEDGYTVILVFAPIPKRRYLSYTNIKDFDKEMKQQALYFNFNELMSLDDSLHFYDSHHLNQDGVNLFNVKLIEEVLEKSKTLKDLK